MAGSARDRASGRRAGRAWRAERAWAAAASSSRCVNDGRELAALAPWLSILARPGQRHPAARGPAEPGSDRMAAVAESLAALEAAEADDASGDRRGPAASSAGRAPAIGSAGWPTGPTPSADAMDFRPLYKPDRHLFAIGSNLGQGQLDNACYDLLASESCLTSYLTVARGDAPRRHWFQLGRPFIRAAGTDRPDLLGRHDVRVPDAPPAACAACPARCSPRRAGRPWPARSSTAASWACPGESPSPAFTAQYLDGDYQYQAFGVPGLGLKRGLEKDQVIAPYATAMATMIAPREALENFRRLAHEGAEGPYGFYEAIDYTPERLPQGKRLGRRPVVHGAPPGDEPGGADQRAARRRDAAPVPRRADGPGRRPAAPGAGARPTRRSSRPTPHEPATASRPGRGAAGGSPLLSRRLTTPVTPVAAHAPALEHAVSRHAHQRRLGRTARCQGLDVTRWREDPTREAWGQFFYIRDLSAGAVWSAGYQPVCRPRRRVRGHLRRRQGHRSAAATADIETLLEVTVSPEQPRRGPPDHADQPRHRRPRAGADQLRRDRAGRRTAPTSAHPAFGKLFLETEWLPGPDALLCRRRPRSADEQPLWAVHVWRSTARRPGARSSATSSTRPIGHGSSAAGAPWPSPAALGPRRGALGDDRPGARPDLQPPPPLPDRARRIGRRRRSPPPSPSSRDEALALADQYHEASAVARAFELAWAHSQVEHRHRELVAEDAHLYQRLASHLLFAGSALRAQLGRARREPPGPARALAVRHLGRPADRPGPDRRGGRARRWPDSSWPRTPSSGSRAWSSTWSCSTRSRASYLDELSRAAARARPRRPGATTGSTSRAASSCSQATQTAGGRADPAPGGGARRPGRRPGLAGQPARPRSNGADPCPAAAGRIRSEPGDWDDEPVALPAGLLFANGLGGFTPDGREYCVLVRVRRRRRPASNGQPAHVVPRPAAPAPRPLGQRRRQSHASASSSPRRARASPGPATARPTA